jgi:hypothetical protein
MSVHDAQILSFGQWWTRSVRGGFGYAEVWSTTSRLPDRVFGAQMRSAFFWMLLLPLFLLVMATAAGEPLLLLLIPTAFVVQTLRIAVRRGFSFPALQSAAMIFLAKLPETVGALQYFLGRKSDRLAEYKAAAR